MRGIASLLAYLVGIFAVVGVELMALTVLLSPIEQTSALAGASTAQSSRPAAPTKVAEKAQRRPRAARARASRRHAYSAGDKAYAYAPTADAHTGRAHDARKAHSARDKGHARQAGHTDRFSIASQ